MDPKHVADSPIPVAATGKRSSATQLHLDFSHDVYRAFESQPLDPNAIANGISSLEQSASNPLDLAASHSSLDIALSALQYLPVPILVLDSSKIVILANEAMGRLCCISAAFKKDNVECMSTAGSLKGETLSQIGIDMIQKDGNPLWVNWEEFLDTIGENDENDENAKKDETGSSSTPRPAGTNSSLATVHDVSVDVILSPVRCMASTSRKSDAENNASSTAQVAAQMIISAWKLDDAKYFTLTFTSPVAQPQPPASPVSSSRTVTKAARLTSSPRTSSTTSSLSNRHHSTDSTPSSTVSSPSASSTTFLPNGPPLKMNLSSLPSVLQKATRLRDALLNCINMPCYAIWHDFSVAVPNQALMKLLPDDRQRHASSTMDFINQFKVWKEDFSRELDFEEYPIILLCRTQKPFHNYRVGVTHPKTGQPIVYDTSGECIWGENEEFQGAIVILKDVTEYLDKIQAQKDKSAQQFDTIADSVPQMVWTTTPDGYHDWFSRRWYDYTGLTEEQSMGLGWQLPFHPDDMPATVPRWHHSLRTGDEYVTEYRCRRKDGEWRWMLGRALPLRDENGSIVRWFGSCTDIHEAVEARESARRNRTQLLQILETAKMTLWAVDMQRDLVVFDGSAAWCNDNYHGPRKQLLGCNVSELFHGMRDKEIASRYREPMEKILGGDSKDESWEVQIPESGRWYRNRYLPVYRQTRPTDTEGNSMALDGAVVISIDVTELREREFELIRQEEENARLEAKAMAAKAARESSQTWVRNVSHDLRTPIGGVIGMSELLLDTNLDQEQRESVENIQRSANGLLTVINDILDLAKVESGRLDIEEVQFSLSVVIDDVYKMMTFAAERKNLVYESHVGKAIAKDFRVMGDPGRLRQVLQNLLTNSIKFTSSGSVILRVEIKSRSQDCVTVEFIVEDTGIGIEEEVQKNLFKPFSQADSSTARRYGGTGLGLSISKNLVELMHGKIRLDSRIGSGTKVSFSIPFRKAEIGSQNSPLVELNPLSDRLQSDLSISCGSSDPGTPPRTPGVLRRAPSSAGIPAGASGRALSNGTLRKNSLSEAERKNIHILVVEDNPINQQIATKTIKQLNFSVSACWNGQEALDYLHQEHSADRPAPDLILMDCQMPVIDGYRATQLIRESKDIANLNSVPIVAMTASAIQGDKEKCEEAGMNDYVAKPVRRKVLESMIVKWALKSIEEKQRAQSPPEPQSSGGSGSVKFQGENPDVPDMKRSDSISPTTMDAGFLHQDHAGSRKFSGPDDTSIVPNVEAGEEAISLRDDKLIDLVNEHRQQKHVTGPVEPAATANGPSHALTQENMDKFAGQQALAKRLGLANHAEGFRSDSSLLVEARQSMESSQASETDNVPTAYYRPVLRDVPQHSSEATIRAAPR